MNFELYETVSASSILTHISEIENSRSKSKSEERCSERSTRKSKENLSSEINNENMPNEIPNCKGFFYIRIRFSLWHKFKIKMKLKIVLTSKYISTILLFSFREKKTKEARKATTKYHNRVKQIEKKAWKAIKNRAK